MKRQLLVFLGIYLFSAFTLAAQPTSRVSMDANDLARTGLNRGLLEKLSRNVNPQEGYLTRGQLSSFTTDKLSIDHGRSAPNPERAASVKSKNTVLPTHPDKAAKANSVSAGTDFGYSPVTDCEAAAPAWLDNTWAAKLCANASNTHPASCAALLSDTTDPLVAVTLCQGTDGDFAAPSACFGASPRELDDYSAAVLCAHIAYPDFPSCYDQTFNYGVFADMSLFNRAVLCTGSPDIKPLGCFIFTAGDVTVNDAVDACSANQNWQTVGASRTN